ncbi:MAG: hypothetical protein ABI999_03965 [Acidobacteriota bacterium]
MKKFFQVIIPAIVLGLSAAAANGQNYKIKQTTSVMGQNVSSTIYVKGSRKRTEQGGIMGMGGDVASIEQCDLRRTLQVNDKKRLYTIDPFPTDSGEVSPSTAGKPVRAIPQKTVKGGTITMTTSINDTGERKQMFGLTARHIKTSMKMEPSPDACTKQEMSMETDGWYVDLPQFSCPMTIPRNPMASGGNERSGGCQDRMIVKYSGGGKMGFPLKVTQTMGGEGQSFATSIETVEFSKATLDDGLFDVPQGYSLANSSSDLYGKPDYAAMARAQRDNDPGNDGSARSFPQTVKNAVTSTKRAGTKRIGVLLPTNQTTETVSTLNLQLFLVQRLTGGNVDAVAVKSEADARSTNCDFLLSSDVSKLKQSTSSKIGGIFGKVTNTDTSGGKNYDAQVDFSLKSLSSGQSVLQNKAAGKASGTADVAAQGMLSQEASSVLAAIR